MNETIEWGAARASEPTLARWARRLILRLSTDNPFYVLSALLVLVGLWTSFGGSSRPEQTYALMLGMAGYTLLLAVPACMLVRFGGVWEDVRTVLLVVVLMFLATSVTFDETLGSDPERGLLCCLGGLAFAVGLSEGVLRVMRLRLPAGFRVPYLLALCLFFAYPAALVPWLDRPRSGELQWGLYGFAATAAALALTLLPAARRGPAYLRDNGSPWPWPYYPWALFVFLGVGVAGRSFLLCWSMQHVESRAGSEVFIFGPYFLAPLALAVGLLLLESGRAAGDATVIRAGLLAPAVAALLSAIGHRDDAVYRGFLDEFTAALGMTPLYASLLAALAFYAVAASRGARGATAGVTATLIASTVVGPETLSLERLSPVGELPWLLLAAWQSLLGWRRGEPGRGALGVGLLSVAVLLGPGEWTVRVGAAFHLALAGLLLLGAILGEDRGRDLRALGAALATVAGLAVVVIGRTDPGSLPGWVVQQYPPAIALAMACYGVLARDRRAYVAAGIVLAAWLGSLGWGLYAGLRDRLTGLDAISMGLVVLALAQLISLGKAGLLPRRPAPAKVEVVELPE